VIGNGIRSFCIEGSPQCGMGRVSRNTRQCGLQCFWSMDSENSSDIWPRKRGGPLRGIQKTLDRRVWV
jgi:hypothetical protein